MTKKQKASATRRKEQHRIKLVEVVHHHSKVVVRNQYTFLQNQKMIKLRQLIFEEEYSRCT